MEIPVTHLPPGDPRLVDAIVGHLKSKGIFDKFRKECLADVDTKPAFQNLRQRVDVQVKKFLDTKTWKTDLNKNQLRDGVRKNIQDSGILDTGIDAIINQVVNPKIKPLILPYIEETVYSFLNIEKPKRNFHDVYEKYQHPPPEPVHQEAQFIPKAPLLPSPGTFFHREMPPKMPYHPEPYPMPYHHHGYPPSVPHYEGMQGIVAPMEVERPQMPMQRRYMPEVPMGGGPVYPVNEDPGYPDIPPKGLAGLEPQGYENAQMEEDNAVDSFDTAREEAESVSRSVERMKIGDDSVTNPTLSSSMMDKDSRPSGLRLYEQQSLDSISSNSSGLSSSPTSRKKRSVAAKDSLEEVSGSGSKSPGEIQSSQSTPLVDEKSLHSETSPSSDNSKSWKPYTLPKDLASTERTQVASVSAISSHPVVSGASPVSAEDSQDNISQSIGQAPSTSSLHIDDVSRDAKSRRKAEKSEGEITSTSGSSSPDYSKGAFAAQRSSSFDKDKAKLLKEDVPSTSSSKERLKDPERKEYKSSRDERDRKYRDKDRRHSKNDDHSSHRSKSRKHHRRDRDDDSEKDRPKGGGSGGHGSSGAHGSSSTRASSDSKSRDKERSKGRSHSSSHSRSDHKESRDKDRKHSSSKHSRHSGKSDRHSSSDKEKHKPDVERKSEKRDSASNKLKDEREKKTEPANSKDDKNTKGEQHIVLLDDKSVEKSLSNNKKDLQDKNSLGSSVKTSMKVFKDSNANITKEFNKDSLVKDMARTDNDKSISVHRTIKKEDKTLNRPKKFMVIDDITLMGNLNSESRRATIESMKDPKNYFKETTIIEKKNGLVHSNVNLPKPKSEDEKEPRNKHENTKKIENAPSQRQRLDLNNQKNKAEKDFSSNSSQDSDIGDKKIFKQKINGVNSDKEMDISSLSNASNNESPRKLKMSAKKRNSLALAKKRGHLRRESSSQDASSNHSSLSDLKLNIEKGSAKSIEASEAKITRKVELVDLSSEDSSSSVELLSALKLKKSSSKDKKAVSETTKRPTRSKRWNGLPAAHDVSTDSASRIVIADLSLSTDLFDSDLSTDSEFEGFEDSFDLASRNYFTGFKSSEIYPVSDSSLMSDLEDDVGFEGFEEVEEEAAKNIRPDLKLRDYLASFHLECDLSLDDFCENSSDEEMSVSKTVFAKKASPVDDVDLACSPSPSPSEASNQDSLDMFTRSRKRKLSTSSNEISSKRLWLETSSSPTDGDTKRTLVGKVKKLVVNAYSLPTPEEDRTSNKEFDIDLMDRAASYSPLSPSSDTSEEVKTRLLTKAKSNSLPIIQIGEEDS